MEIARPREKASDAARRLGAIADRQTSRLDALVRSAAAARPAAICGELFSSRAGHALVNAAFDLFECEGLYALREDVAHELRRIPE